MIRILDLKEVEKSEIFLRKTPKVNVEAVVSAILTDVKTRGDEALLEYTERFDGAKLETLEVSAREIREAFEKTDPEFLTVLRTARANIENYHRNQIRTGFIENGRPGVVTGQKVLPLERVGIYVPGGTAAYPSTVLMNTVPAKLAGVSEIVIVTPPGKDGKVNPAVLAAANVAGVDRIFKVGGAQAVAALAFGTESIPKVDKIVGPGNAFVAEAKKQVFGQVNIDMIAGPSEILIVADKTMNAKYLAADLLSQAEHDKMASAVLVTDDLPLAKAVQEALEEQIPLLARSEIARASIDDNGKIIVAKSISEAIGVANEIAPEHLELALEKPFDWLDCVKNAGSVFLGQNCPEALGDYYAGPNHTLPTGGTARFSSPLSVDDFVKKMQYTYYSREALLAAAPDVARFANEEGLTGHAKSVLIRTEEAE